MTDRQQSTTTCLGTRQIKIRTTNKKEFTSALLIVCLSNDDAPSSSSGSSQDQSLVVSISDGIDTYSTGLVDPSKNSKLGTVQEFTNHLLDHELEGIKLSFEYYTDKGEIKLKATIKKQLKTEIVKIIWPGVLTKNHDKGCLSILQTLGLTIEIEHEKHKSLGHQCLQLQTDLASWKDTAEKLEGSWQSEKNVLLEHFHTLYKATHEELRKTKLAYQQLENRHQAAGNDYTSPHINKRRTGAANNNRVDHLPDDQDELIYDMATVTRLAAGPKKSTGTMTKKKPTLATSSNVKAKPKTAVTSTRPPRPTPVPLKLVTTPSKRRASSTKKLSEDAQVDRVKNAQAGPMVVASVQDLLKDPILSKRKRIENSEDTLPLTKQKHKETNKLPPAKPSASKKPKISALVDEKKRKELERLSAILDDEW